MSEEPEKSDLSCKGCMYDYYLERSRKYGCIAPNKEPYNSCKARRVIFKE